MSACAKHLPNNRSCPYESVYVVGWTELRWIAGTPTPTPTLHRAVCAHHLVSAIEDGIERAGRDGFVEIRMAP